VRVSYPSAERLRATTAWAGSEEGKITWRFSGGEKQAFALYRPGSCPTERSTMSACFLQRSPLHPYGLDRNIILVYKHSNLTIVPPHVRPVPLVLNFHVPQRPVCPFSSPKQCVRSCGPASFV
jgi:hypothetical protein